MTPNYCFNAKMTDDTAPLVPALQSWAVDIELSWNNRVTLADAKIKDDFVEDTPKTSDLLCSPGKYTEQAWKPDNLYDGFGPTWDGGWSNIPKEAIGFSL